MPRNVTHLLATDLDGTLVGNKDTVRQLFNYLNSWPYKVTLAYVTGRHLQFAIDLIRNESLQLPGIIVTVVNTEI